MKRFINWCRRYISIFFIAIVAAVAYILFFNENSVSHQAELKTEIRRLQYEIKAVSYNNLTLPTKLEV
ncbi:MAG: hypothetical protein K2G64_06895, partial [Muribaculaceae bacterium]|nr:hypothetical protein [Muribaculaceae bacterium]